MVTEINRVKVSGELYAVLIKLTAMQGGAEYRRFSPQTKEVIEMLVTSVRACKQAVYNGHPLMFQINVWEQQSLTGWAIDLKDVERE